MTCGDTTVDCPGAVLLLMAHGSMHTYKCKIVLSKESWHYRPLAGRWATQLPSILVGKLITSQQRATVGESTCMNPHRILINSTSSFSVPNHLRVSVSHQVFPWFLALANSRGVH